MKPKRISQWLLHLIGIALLLAVSSCDSNPPREEAAQAAAIADTRGVIVAMGDSLTAGLGVAPEQSYPALLERMLAEKGMAYRVINAGISGETSSGARSRVAWVLRLKPDIVILETGANDGLRGIDPALIEENIDAIITRLEEEGVTVVLAGMMMVTNLGPDYVSAFNDVYPRLADHHQLIFMPFFLEGVAAEPSLNQADGIHPNSAGYNVIASNVLPFAEQAIRARQP